MDITLSSSMSKFFLYMMGKALSGELSCMLIGLVTRYYNIVFCMSFSDVIDFVISQLFGLVLLLFSKM